MRKSKTKLKINDKKIEKEVARCDRIIKGSSSEDVKATNYRLKALSLEQLKDPSDEIKQEIENCFKEAIKLNPDKKAFYLADLSNFYLFSSNNIEAAIQNITTIEESSQVLTGIDRVYVNKTVTNIKKLNNAKKQIKSELEKGNITREFAKSLLDHLDVTKNHEHKLDAHEQLFKIVLARLSDVEKQLEVSKEHIETINDKITIIDDKLEKTGINDKAKLKDQIERLEYYEYEGVIKPALNESLKDYANSFYWTLANKILAYRVLNTENIEGQVWENTAVERLELASNAITKIGRTVCSYVPMYGSSAAAVFESIDMVSFVVLEVIQLYTDAKNKRMVKLVNYELFLGRDKLEINPEELLNQGLLSGAIEIARGKSDIINKAITDPTSQEPIKGLLNQIGNIRNTFIKEVIDPIMDTFFDVKVVCLNEVQKLAIADSALFITWLIDQRSGKQEKEAFTKGINNPQEFGQKIAELYNEGGEIDKMLNAPAFITNIKAYVEAIKECIDGIKETKKEARGLVSDIPETADDIREYGKDEIVDKIKKGWQSSTLYRLKVKVKTKIDNYRNNKKAEEQDIDYIITDKDYDNELLDHSELISRSNISLSEDTSNDSIYEVKMSGDSNLGSNDTSKKLIIKDNMIQNTILDHNADTPEILDTTDNFVISNHFDTSFSKNELDRFWKNKQDFIHEYKSSQPALSDDSIYSLLLNTAIVLNNKEIIRYILEKSYSENILTHVDKLNYSPISRALYSGNKEILQLVGDYIKQNKFIEKVAIIGDDFNNIITILEFSQFEDLTVEKCIEEYLKPLYIDESINKIEETLLGNDNSEAIGGVPLSFSSDEEFMFDELDLQEYCSSIYVSGDCTHTYI